MRGKLVGDVRARCRMAENVAARRVDFVGEGHHDRVRRSGAEQVSAHGDDTRDCGFPSGGGRHDFIADLEAAGSDGAGEATEGVASAIDPLHRQPQRRIGAIRLNVDVFEIGQETGAVTPRHIRRVGDDIVPMAGGDGDCFDGAKGERCGDAFKFADNSFKHGLVVINKIHFVDGQHDVPDAKERGDRRMSPRLSQQTLAGVDEQYGQLGVRRCPSPCCAYIAHGRARRP